MPLCHLGIKSSPGLMAHRTENLSEDRQPWQKQRTSHGGHVLKV